MDIQINDKFSLESDDNNFILMETKISKEGKTRKERIGFYWTLDLAMNGFVGKSIKQSDATTFQELKNDLEIIKNTISEIKIATQGA